MELQLLVEKRTGKIIYAEAGKDFVDLLFSFVVMPIGTVIKMLSSSSFKKLGSINNVYESIEKLPPVYMKCDKNVSLDPMVDSSLCHEKLRINYVTRTYYVCGCNTTHVGTRYITNRSDQKCSCGNSLGTAVHFGGIRNSCDFVKETVTFMITDDLTISPISTVASIALLNGHDLSQLELKSVMVEREQAVKLLWASLVSTSALNDVFSETVSVPTKEGLKQTV